MKWVDLSQFQFDYDLNWAAMFVIAENDADNAYSAGLWSRFDWAWDGTDLYYCQTAFAEATEADALAVPAADSSDLLNAGCGAYDFPWSKLTP